MPHAGRVYWGDYAKGFCIVMVVMMHSTLLVLYWLVRNTPFRFLFARPEWAKLDRKRAPALQPAE